MKETVAVLFGGQSSEHEVSCMSAVNVAEQIDTDLYDILLIGITKEGHWVPVDSVDDIIPEDWAYSKKSAFISPDAAEHCVILTDENGREEKIYVDVVFPVLHGPYGEDGTVQGLLELAGIPYVGCGVLASAVSMDKLMTKIIVDSLGIPQAEYVPVMKAELEDMGAVLEKIESRLSYPVFVKPANAGSSRGISKAKDRENLETALYEAARHDRRILVEETITGHEVECAVFGGGNTPATASGVGEILAGAEFYDYDAKYNSTESKTVTDPVLPGDATEEIRSYAVQIFNAVDGYGLARVDFFVRDDGQVIFNEINTMPGFTSISMYPMLWETRGVSKAELVQKLLDHAKERYNV